FRRRCSFDRTRVAENEGDLARRIVLELGSGGRRLARRCTWRPSGEVSRSGEEFGTCEAGDLLDRADRTATCAAVEVVPVAGMIALERDHARAGPARSIATNVGETPFVAAPPPVWEQVRHPCVGARTQTRDNRIEVET